MNEIAQQNSTISSDLEALLIEGDLSKLSPDQRVIYYRKTCDSLGLNYLTRPFDYIRLSGKLTLYARKDATEQLRKINHISIVKLEAKIMSDIYVVTAYARTSEGQEDISTGAVSIKGLQGEALANAFLKSETKAKRRVTLSICGLGLTDESEIDSIPNAQIVKSNPVTGEIFEQKKKSLPMEELKDPEQTYVDTISLMGDINNMEELGEMFKSAIKTFRGRQEYINKLIECKDRNKLRIENIITIEPEEVIIEEKEG